MTLRYRLRAKGCLRRVLQFNDQVPTAAVAHHQVHAIALQVFFGTVALALEQLQNRYAFAQQCGEKAFEHVEVRLVPQDGLDRQVEAYDRASLVHNQTMCCAAVEVKTDGAIVSMASRPGSGWRPAFHELPEVTWLHAEETASMPSTIEQGRSERLARSATHRDAQREVAEDAGSSDRQVPIVPRV